MRKNTEKLMEYNSNNGNTTISILKYGKYKYYCYICETRMFNLLLLTKTNYMNTSTREILIPKIKEYFATQPITKAWLFGSFSRGEETENSDVDILVDFDKNARIGLFKYASIYSDLKELLGREVDLVQNGALKAFAIESAEQDKILIYERTN